MITGNELGDAVNACRPDPDRSGVSVGILLGRGGFLKGAIGKRIVLDMDRHALLGRIVAERTMTNSDSFDITSLNAGAYIAQLRSPSGIEVLRFNK